MNPDNEVIYTSANNKHTYKDFINAIYAGLTKLFDDDDTLPSSKDALSVDLDKMEVFDKIVNVPYHSKQCLFEIADKGNLIDLTQNEITYKEKAVLMNKNLDKKNRRKMKEKYRRKIKEK